MTGPADPDAARDRAAAQHRRAGAVAEHEHAQEVVRRGVRRAERERGHLDGNDQRQLLGMGAKPVGSPGQRRGTTGAPEIHERHPPDIAAEAELIDQLHIDSGENESRA